MSTPTLIDTHAHLYVEGYDLDRDAAVARAADAGVTRILLPAIDSEYHEVMLAAAARRPEVCTPMMGVHPTSMNDNPQWRRELEIAEAYLKNPPPGGFCAIGETGLDFYHSRDFKEQQMEAFRIQLGWGLRYDLPMVLHSRNATDETLHTIAEFPGTRGVFHAWSGSVETYRAIKKLGDFMFGISGVVTFKNASLAAVVQQMELTDIVLETDCPWLTPTPFRGQRNEPSYIPYICQKVAELKNLPIEEVARQTTRNAERMYGL